MLTGLLVVFHLPEPQWAPAHGSLEGESSGVWLLGSSLLLDSRLPPSELPGVFSETQTFLPPTPMSGLSLWQLLDQDALYTLWPQDLTRASVVTDLRLFKAGDRHEDVVEVGAAPPQHIHPLLASFLP